MSYLDTPRLHFAGRFFTDPSTVNNDPAHYDPSCTEPSPWQEPNGLHRFSFQQCQITSVVDQHGPNNSDPVIGCAIESVTGNSEAKIVDLDVYQQGISTIYGLRLSITLPDNSMITGLLDPATLNDFWANSVLPTRSWEPGDYGQDSYGGDMNACGVFQTVMRVNPADWPINSPSAALNTLRSTTLTDDQNQLLVSVKFVVDGYENVPQNSQFRTGRIVGALGPVFANEPLYNPGQRWLWARPFNESDPWYYPSFNNAPFKVDTQRQVLVLDLGNSICRASAGGDPVFLDQVYAYINTGSSEELVLQLGPVNYSGFAYNNNALIVEIPLSDIQCKALLTGTLRLCTSLTTIGNPVILQEYGGIADFSVEVRPLRVAGDVNPTVTTRVYVSQAGQPLPNKQLALNIASVHGNTPGATVPPTYPGDTPQADGAIDATISPSDQNGYATVTINVLRDPGKRTEELDGQLYFINVYDPDLPEPDWSKFQPIQRRLISCLAFSYYTINEKPTWAEIQNIMAPYAKLYPGMTAKINLTDEGTFYIFAINPPWAQVYNDNTPGPLGINSGAIPYYMSRPFEDPMYMPVSRDMSPNKVMTVMHYIYNLPLPMKEIKTPHSHDHNSSAS